jgi:hypothetical protein
MLTKKWKAKAKASKKKSRYIYLYLYIQYKEDRKFLGAVAAGVQRKPYTVGGDPTALRVAFKETRHSDLQH